MIDEHLGGVIKSPVDWLLAVFDSLSEGVVWRLDLGSALVGIELTIGAGLRAARSAHPNDDSVGRSTRGVISTVAGSSVGEPTQKGETRMNSARLTRLRIAVGTGVVLALVAVTTAGALDSFTDVADGRFFHGPVKWAADNGITTGTSPTTFEPDRGVTRGESVTFLKRYDDNIVQPAFADRLGRMEIKEIDLALTKGETMNVGSLDGVTVKVTCADAGGGKTDIRIFATSDADGWYMPWHSPSVLSKTDVGEFIALGVYATTIEVASARIDGFSIRTPNGGYTAIDGETLMWVLNPSADPYDCLVVGMYQYFDPA